MSTTPNFGAGLQPIAAQIQNSDSTGKVTLATAGSTPRKISALMASSTDTSDRAISFFLTSGGVDFLICTLTVSASAGNAAATPPLNVLGHTNWQWFEYDAAGNKCCVLPASGVLKAASAVQLTSAKLIAIVGNGQDYA